MIYTSESDIEEKKAKVGPSKNCSKKIRTSGKNSD